MPITGGEIRRIREALGLTQVQFAELLGTIGNTVAKWERNEAAPRETTARLIWIVAEQQGVGGRPTQKAAKKR